MVWPLLAAAAPYIAGAAATVGSALTGESANDANRQQAHLNRQFQENMSNSAYQRAVKDMKAAGLNPMLAYQQGGASTPGGAQAKIEDIGTPALGAGVAAYSAANQQRLQTETMKANVNNTNANTDKTRLEAQLVASKIPNSAKMADLETYKLKNEVDNLAKQWDDMDADIVLKMNEAGQKQELYPMLIQYQRYLNQAAELDIPAKEAEADFYNKIGAMGKGAKLLQLFMELAKGMRGMR